MPPRRSTRAAPAASSAPATKTTAKRSTRAKKEPSPEVSGEEDDLDSVSAAGGHDDDEEEEEEEVEEDVKPKIKRGASKAKPKAKAAPAPARRSARASVASVASETEHTESEDELELPPPKTKSRSKKAAPAPKPRPKTPEMTSEDEDEAEEELQSALRGQRGTVAPSEPATPTPHSRTLPREQSATPRAGASAAGAPEINVEAPADGTPRPSTPSKMPPPQTPSQPQRAPLSQPAPAPPPAPSGPKPRLTIHKIVLVNFKSYAGRQEIGPFHKSFSAIVGPNGSGKSNTIDALLFVFGYRASKMRQGKLSELIHNSAKHQGLESCSVEVWFREIVDLPGSDKFLLVPNSQIIVNRTAFRNNSSKYTINDRPSTFTEVTTLLKGKGIDLDHNRFLILQGEVESIAQMKAKAQNEHEDGLLEYLEDIIGTTKYKEPIEQASLEVEALNEERGEKMNRLRVVEREKAALESKKQEAEDYLRNANELTRKKSLLYQKHMYTLQSNIDITTKAIENLTAQLSSEQELNADHLATIDALQKEYDEQVAAFAEVKKHTDTLTKEAKKIEKEEVGLQERKKHLVTKQKKIKKSITDDGHAKSEAQATIENCTEQLEKNRIKVAELEEKLEAEQAEHEEIVESLKDKTSVFTTQIEAKQRELQPWNDQIREKQGQIDVATSHRDGLAEKATSKQGALDEARENLKSLKEGGEGKHEDYARLKKEAVRVKKAIADGEAKLEELTGKWEGVRAKVSNSRHKADEAKASMAADRSENAVLSSLNKLRDQGRIKGFHGRLGDLGVIDDKYDVAVTTACPTLNNLIVDTVKQGEACIDFLRKGNIGRANIMVLEKLPARVPAAIQTPENVPRLFDLIKPKDAKFAPAFFKGLGNTLVANDLEQAQRIGFGSSQRWRVVTLGGQLIDPSGTMSGGGNRVARGGMSSKFKADKVAPEVVAKLEQDTAAAEADLAKAQEERKAVVAELQEWKKRLPQIEMEMSKIELDVATSGKRVEEAERRLAELQSESKPIAADEKRIKELDAEIASLTKETDKLRTKSSAINDELKSLQEKILEVGGVRLRAIQSKVATTKCLVDLANDAITKAEVGQAKAERDVEKLGKAIIKNQTTLEEVEGELEQVEADLASCTADLQTLRERVQEAVDSSEDVKEALEQSKQELDEKMQGINAFRALEMELKQKIDDSTRSQKDSKDKYKHWLKRHETLELVYIDEEDEDEEKGGEGEPKDTDQPAEPVEEDEGAEDAEGAQEDAEPKAKKEKVPAKKKHQDSMELAEYSPDELMDVDNAVLSAEIAALEDETSKARPNLNILAEYRRREAEFLDRAKDLERVTGGRDAAKARYDDLRKVRLDEFMAGFTAITAKLKEMYQMITMGGNAEIELIDSMDPFSEGVVLSIMPPKKSWRAIANLSGGEKTLASLALVFALHVFKPTPLYFMDEIDAALDFKNVSIVANYIQSKTQAAQFIVISLRNDMFELAHRLVGIYKTDNCTKSLAIENKDLRLQARPKRPANVPPTPSVGSGAVPATPAFRRQPVNVVRAHAEENEDPSTPGTVVG
ncbi:hypothetical protein L202_04024 [Cryptococcus amylolentus CBS 6039]|uniref:Structural maintenance of chromosomes protein 4 n=1 Tax=Cryptococcus amylolentus CBS 6039 TaxID=1295533 RepID=A0A1E3HQG9_9TREE|nr:hypothetical protein L202_04024 [Cryptococcus amylolentus CBS 6039]ODN78385.1 hypothetical protein L202_04024 [Cryptococcus amylolentus CBS 6039]